MDFSARQIAELLDGEVDGNPDATVNTLSKIEEGTPGSLSFLGNLHYEPHLYSTEASIVIIPKDFKPAQNVKSTLLRVENAHEAFSKLLEMYDQIQHDKKGVDSQSVVSDSAQIGEDAYIGALTFVGENSTIGKNTKIYPGCFIGDNVKIGNNCLIFSGARIYANCEIGNEITLHSGVIIGGDGFGFVPKSGDYQKVPQIGNVILEDGVEVGANTTIDRATLGHTIIRRGVKLDNLIQVAHNVEIGESTVIAAQTGIAGSTKIGKNCMIGGQVGIVGHLKIGDGVKIAAQSGIGNDLKDNEIVQGSPAFPIGEYKRAYVGFRNLTQIAKDISDLKKEIAELKK